METEGYACRNHTTKYNVSTIAYLCLLLIIHNRNDHKISIECLSFGNWLTSLCAKFGDLKLLQSKNIEGGVKRPPPPSSTTLKKGHY